jgi:threonine/homoserine/homoserine lactone efflux protein
MNIKLKALGYTVGAFGFIFAVIAGLSYLTPKTAPIILGSALVVYLMYLMYQIKLSEYQWEKDRTFD